jgi:hypothetical protein
MFVGSKDEKWSDAGTMVWALRWLLVALCILVLALASAILAQLFTNYQSNINSK